METLIIIIIIAWAIREGVQSGHLSWQSSKAANRKASRGKSIPRRAASAVQHDVGYWAHRILNGFPEARHGLFMGWHAGRVAQLEAAAKRAQAQTGHVQARAKATQVIREQRQRQQEILDEIRAAAMAVIEGADWDIPPAGGPVPAGPPPQSAGAVAPPPDPAPPLDGGARVPPTKGNEMASDVTYDSVIRDMAAAVDAAEEHGNAARAAQRQAAQAADQMQALDVDPATLGAMADHLDALDVARKAHEHVLETARAVDATLRRGHAQLAEAHKDAVVEAADKAFYHD